MLIRDLKLLTKKQKSNIKLTNFQYIISSWTVFVYFLFNPTNTVYITGWFWFFRGILEKEYINTQGSSSTV